uniref:TFIIS N-terminal domain-containing protein n=1 Tax=Angiostrongylus cantonensis TaxID=6313 RepID=A0A0K0DIZ5_ANGCA
MSLLIDKWSDAVDDCRRGETARRRSIGEVEQERSGCCAGCQPDGRRSVPVADDAAEDVPPRDRWPRGSGSWRQTVVVGVEPPAKKNTCQWRTAI